MTLSITEKQKPIQPEDKEVVLSVEGVSKKFCRDLKRSLFYGVQDITTDLVGLRKSNTNLRPQEFWALDNVSFQLRKGEALGLVGKNGSGKSTLLRIIAGLIKPDKGIVRVKGRVAPLIALGAGFNPILTGRENIYANMSILGLSTKEINARFDEVVEFAEIGDAIDSPVRSYSSGMAARLGFATAIHTEPDILLIDEVLSVGDVRFRAKCFRELQNLRKKNITFIIVSHQSTSILDACQSAIYLSNGKHISTGSASEIIKQYESDLFSNSSINQIQVSTLSEKIGQNLGIKISEIFFRDSTLNKVENIITGEPSNLCVQANVIGKFDHIYLYVVVKECTNGSEVLYLTNAYDEYKISASPGDYEFQLHFPCLGLKAGTYIADISIREERQVWLDRMEFFSFEVISKYPMPKNQYYQSREWRVKNV